MKYFLSFLLILVFVSCQSVKLLKTQAQASDKFLDHIRIAKNFIAQRDYRSSWNKLGELNNWNLNETESALADNMRGSILFKLRNFEKAEKYFRRSLASSVAGTEINSQVRLNLANLYHKQGKLNESWEMMNTIPPESLYKTERKKYALFKYKLAQELKVPRESVQALVQYFDSFESYRTVVDNPISQHMIVQFSQLPQQTQEDVIDIIPMTNFSKIALIQKYLNEYLYLIDSSKANNLISQLGDYKEDQDAIKIYEDFKEAKDGGQNFNNLAIGIVVPLTGKMARFGKNVLKGVDLALFDIYGANKPKVFVEDSHGNGVAAKLAVKKLIEQHGVSYIVGGVLSKTASEQFLEAKKYGTLFFSLSPIYLSFAEKNSLLFEVFGSIESQVAELFNDENLDRNQSNFVMVYPESEAGRAYYKEVLRQAPSKGAVLKGAVAVTPGLNDYREDVKKLLEVDYVKSYLNGTDELEESLMGNREVIYTPVPKKIEYDKNGRKIKQNQKALNLDFNWAYVPALPNDALQIIPSFRFFEARNLKYYGIPSWKTRTFLNRHIGLGHLFFVSSENSILMERFTRLYKDRFGYKPGIVESMAYESVSLGNRIIGKGKNLRSQVVEEVSNLNFIEGFSSSWHKQDGIWFKDMDTFKVEDRSTKKIY